jgi:tetrapyrrole methylase family protein/MazG family protein
MKTNPDFQGLIELIRTLRKKCPWDKKQTLLSLKNKMIEEVYELIEAIDRDSKVHIKEEIGDVLFLTLFLTSIFEQEKGVNIEDLIDAVIEKYVSKHPHVFAEKDLRDEDAVLEYWHKNKEDLFAGIPVSLPALLAARTIQERAAQVGFDWESYEGPLEKVKEELSEVSKSVRTDKIFEEFGDLLFACVNFARHLNIEPEDALRHSNKKFAARFRLLQKELKQQNKDFTQVSLKEMDEIWDAIKQDEA